MVYGLVRKQHSRSRNASLFMKPKIHDYIHISPSLSQFNPFLILTTYSAKIHYAPVPQISSSPEDFRGEYVPSFAP
jgi:hypothetical protein